MLTILNDPAGVTGRSRHQLNFGITLQANIALHAASGGDSELRINGEPVDPLTDPRLDLPPMPLDTIVLARRPGAVGAFVAAYGWYIAYAVALIYIITNLPRSPGANGASGKDSPNNSLSGQSNVARAYQAVPDVYGYRRVWPDLIQPSTVEYVDHVKYVTEWLCISRGKGALTDVRYAETPIVDIDGAAYELFEPVGAGYPELATTTLLDVIETFSSAEVNGQELPLRVDYTVVGAAAMLAATGGNVYFTLAVADGANLADLKSLAPLGTAQVEFGFGSGEEFDEVCTVLSYVVAGSTATFTFGCSAWVTTEGGSVNAVITPNGSHYTTMGPYTLPLNGERIRWNTVFLRGLKGSVSVRSEWWLIDSDGVEVPGSREQQVDAYMSNTLDQRFFTTEVEPSAGAGRYRIEFTRLSNQVNEEGADVAKLEELYAVRHYPTKELPGVTVIRVKTKATNEATGFSERKFNMRWQRKVRTLVTDILSESRNFARALAHMWTIAGYDIDQIDTAALAAINSEHGEDSPLLRFDGSLDDNDMSLGERMQLIAGTARCDVWRDGVRWTVTREQAKPYPELQLDYRNLSAKGDSVLGYAAHLPATNDGVEIEYADEATQAKKAYVRLNITTGVPVVGNCGNPKKIRLSGCATEMQAVNRAHLEARRLLFQRTNVTDTALCDGGILGKGSLVRWIDPNDFGGDDGLQAGEVMSITGMEITTSEPLDWKGEVSGRIRFTGADGLYLGGAVACSPTAAGVLLASAPAGLFVADPARQCGSRYVFSVGLTEAELESAGLYTTTEIKPAADGTVSLAFAQYDARMFEAD